MTIKTSSSELIDLSTKAKMIATAFVHMFLIHSIGTFIGVPVQASLVIGMFGAMFVGIAFAAMQEEKAKAAQTLEPMSIRVAFSTNTTSLATALMLVCTIWTFHNWSNNIVKKKIGTKNYF